MSYLFTCDGERSQEGVEDKNKKVENSKRGKTHMEDGQCIHHNHPQTIQKETLCDKYKDH